MSDEDDLLKINKALKEYKEGNEVKHEIIMYIYYFIIP